MGHRASVAYTDGNRVAGHYSHWGAHDVKLLDEISEDTPFGGSDLTPKFFDALKEMLAANLSDDAEMEAHEEPEIGNEELSQRVPVSPEPYWEGESLEDWAREAVDYLHHEAAYVVDTNTWDVRAFATVRWMGYEPPRVEGQMPHHGRGALVEVADADEYVDTYGVEYEWEDDLPTGDEMFTPEGAEKIQNASEYASAEEEFEARLHAAFGDRIPEFSQYHPA